MTMKEITSATPSCGGGEYKGMLPRGVKDLNEMERFAARKIKKSVYPSLELPAHWNAQWDSSAIFDVVLKAGFRNACLEDTVKNWNKRHGDTVPNADTVFYRLKKVKTEEWIEKFNKANGKLLNSAVKARAFERRVDIAIDTHDVLFYGDKETEGIVGREKERGTTRAFRYMTLCITTHRDHYTAAALPMKKGTKKEDVLRELLKIAFKYVKKHIRYVYVDRDFYSTGGVNVFEECKVHFVMPAKKYKKVKKIMRENEAPFVTPYEMRGKAGTFTITLVIVKDKKGVKRAFATNFKVEVSEAEKLFDLYRNRWTVDTSYRMVGEVRTKTTSVNYAVRFFFFLISLLIMNGYWLFNAVLIQYGHTTLISFGELFIEVKIDMIQFCEVRTGDG